MIDFQNGNTRSADDIISRVIQNTEFPTIASTSTTMWGLNAGLAWLAASAQLPFDAQVAKPVSKVSRARTDFKLVEGEHVLSPKTMLELPRPGAGLANAGGDLALVSVNQFKFEQKK